MEIKNYQFEIWRPVFGYEGCYEVSNFGRVKALKRYVYNPKYGQILLKGHLMKTPKDIYGYPAILLAKNGKRKQYKVHRLVAIAFFQIL